MNKTFNPMSELFKYFSISLGFMLLGFVLGTLFIPIEVIYALNILQCLLMFVLIIAALLSRKDCIPSSFPMFYVYIFTFLNGILLYPVFMIYLMNLGVKTFLVILLSAVAIFALFSVIAGKSEPGKFVKLNKLLIPMLLVLMLMSIVNIFLRVDTISIVLSALGLIVFTGYVLVDLSEFKYEVTNGMIRTKDDLSIFVFDLYVDFINILLDLLNLVSKVRD